MDAAYWYLVLENKYDHIIGDLKYDSFLPCCELRSFICNYTFIKGIYPRESAVVHAISNGYIELSMHFDDFFICEFRKNKKYALTNYVAGLNNGSKTIETGPAPADGKVSGMVIRFTHKGVSQLMGINICDLSPYFIKMEEIWGLRGRLLYEDVNYEPENIQRKKILDDFFLGLIIKEKKHDPVNLDVILKLCSERGQKATVENLARSLCLSYRTLYRKFEKEIGLCPKDYMKMVRINRICGIISGSRKIDLPDILYYGGYYDQAHFIKEFKETMNITPAELLKISNSNFYITRGMRIE